MSARPRTGFANAVSLLALFIALSGTAIAARHYLLTSTKQISPKVLKTLRGRTGPRGPRGVQGIPGTPATVTTTLPSGLTLRGEFKLDDTVQSTVIPVAGMISFGGYTLASAPALSAVGIGGQPTARCPGTVSNPAAARGYLCFYLADRANVDTSAPYDLGPGMTAEDAATGTDGKADRFGAFLYAKAAGTGRVEIDGTWAVTAP